MGLCVDIGFLFVVQQSDILLPDAAGRARRWTGTGCRRVAHISGTGCLCRVDNSVARITVDSYRNDSD